MKTATEIYPAKPSQRDGAQCGGVREMTALEVINNKLADFREISEHSDRVREGLTALRDCLPSVLPAKADQFLKHMVSRVTLL